MAETANLLNVCQLSTNQTMPGSSLDSDVLLECLAAIMSKQERRDEEIANGLDSLFRFVSACLMFFMQAGFAMLCAGSVRQKNVQNTLMKNLLDACGAAIGFWSVGYALAFGDPETADGSSMTTFSGSHHFGLLRGFDDHIRWLFQFAFAATSTTIVAGTLAERSRMIAYVSYSMLLTALVYPLVAHQVWSPHGILYQMGVVDFAGSAVVHTTGGITALIATIVLGPRKNRFVDDGLASPLGERRVTGHSPALQVLGAFILWLGWFGFNTGSTSTISTNGRTQLVGLAAIATALGGACGCIGALSISSFLTERRTGETTYDLVYTLNGGLSGLVSITAGCAVMEPWVSLLVGLAAGVLYVFASELLVKWKIDDAVDAIPVHFVNGIWGTVAVGLFANPVYLKLAYGDDFEKSGLVYTGDFSLLGVNLLALVGICIWVLLVMGPFFLVLSYMGLFRADPLEELVGLDISFHGITRPTSYGDDMGVVSGGGNGNGDGVGGERHPDLHPESAPSPTKVFTNTMIKREQIQELIERRKRESLDNVL